MAVDSQESINHTKPGVFFPSLYGVFWMFSLYGDCFTMRILLFLFFFLSLSLYIYITRFELFSSIRWFFFATGAKTHRA